MDYLASLDSSRDLQPICAKSFINRLHLVLQIDLLLILAPEYSVLYETVRSINRNQTLGPCSVPKTKIPKKISGTRMET